MASDPLLAAGAVLWRASAKHGCKIAVVHRPRYDDWSLPKGKCQASEPLTVTAAREVIEETGFALALGRRLGQISYPVPAGEKTVHFFAARALHGRFRPNREVDRIRWLTLPQAMKVLRHSLDQQIVAEFGRLPVDLAGLLLVRHAHAGQRESFTGDDSRRPLDDRGRAQAKALAAELAVFGPHSVHSAPLTRCRDTVAPLASTLHLRIRPEPLLSESEYQRDPASARRRVLELALRDTGGRLAVVCSQGGVIPGVVKSLAGRAGLSLPTAGTPKAGYWFLAFDGKQLVQADRYVGDH